MNESKKLVLVVGAGASNEVGLPLGSDLKKRIATALNHEYEFGQLKRGAGSAFIESAYKLIVQKANNGLVGDINPYVKAGWMVRDGMSQALSIDNYLDAHKDNHLMIETAKLAIAEVILLSERNSGLHLNPLEQKYKLNFSTLESTWYGHFFKLLTEGCQVEKIAERLSSVAIVTFNYDRCIEQYLHEALMNYYHIDSAYAIELMSELQIFHPYGYLGELKWPSAFPNVSFGGEIHSHQLIEVSGKIKTFTEGTDEDSSEILEIRDCIEGAEKIVFLGFAYGKQNLDLLYTPKSSEYISNAQVYGTAFQMSDINTKLIREDLFRLGGYAKENVYINSNLTSTKLFEDCSRALSLF